MNGQICGISPWHPTYEGVDPGMEGVRETLCTLGNGYLASRGAAPESPADDTHYPGTYIAGCYNRLRDTVAGQVVENESLVNLPNWLTLTFRVDDGPWWDLTRVEILEHHQQLDLRHGLLRRELRFRRETIPKNIDYYLARTTHGSTLSAVVHGWVLARAHRHRAMEFLHTALDSDITDIQGGTTAEGIHLAAMAGSVDLLQRCFTGIEARGDTLWLNPCWPEELGTLRFTIHQHQGRNDQM